MFCTWVATHQLHVNSLYYPSLAPGSPPRNIQAKGTSDNSFEATWLPPLEPNGIIRGYRLFYSTDLKKDFKQWQYKTSALNQTDVTGLQRETTYFFRLMSYNDAGEGPLTELFAVKTARGGELKDDIMFWYTSKPVKDLSFHNPLRLSS